MFGVSGLLRIFIEEKNFKVRACEGKMFRDRGYGSWKDSVGKGEVWLSGSESYMKL